MEGGPSFDGVFKDDGLPGMIEAAEIRKLDTLSPFIGSFQDLVCRESDECPITTAFTAFVDVLNQFFWP